MAPLAHTLALLAMTVATVAVEVIPLDMAENSFDDQYQGCGPAMTAALPALNRSELQKNSLFAQAWREAVAAWLSHNSPLSPLSSQDQAITVMAYSMESVYEQFNTAVREAGRSPQEYRDKFDFKTFHFLLTQAVVTLRDAQKAQCHDVFRGVRGIRFEVESGKKIRFGQFASTSLSKDVAQTYGTDTIFEVHTCHGADIQAFSYKPGNREVLIPPFETFEVTEVTQAGNTAQIKLRSTGISSKYNCEWLKGGSIPRASFHLGGLLLATTVLGFATGIL